MIDFSDPDQVRALRETLEKLGVSSEVIDKVFVAFGRLVTDD